jgi:hypothetical protein
MSYSTRFLRSLFTRTTPCSKGILEVSSFRGNILKHRVRPPLLLRQHDCQNMSLGRTTGLAITQTSIQRAFRTTTPRPAVPPIILLVAARLGKYVAVFLGRHFRVWYKKLPAETKAEYTTTAKKNRGKLYGNI